MKTILTLFFAMAIAVAVNAQSTQDSQQTKTSGEPVKQINSEVIKAKPAVKPTNAVSADKKEKDLSQVKKDQDQQKQTKQDAPVNRVTTQDLKQQELQKKQEVYDLRDDKPKE